MSDYLPQNIDYLDERTHRIIDGYFRLSFPFKIIPTDIIHLTTLFIDDHFMLTRGTFEWIIDNEILQQMKKAEQSQRFPSKKFKISELDWLLDVYPCGNADDRVGNFEVFLRLLLLPRKWKDIILCFSLHCNETLCSKTSVATFNDVDHSWGWPIDTMRLSDIQSLNRLSLTTSIRINKIILKDNEKVYYQRNVFIPKNSKLEWRIDDDLLSKMKMCQNGRRFTSPIYNNTFCLDICPNGSDSSDRGWTQISLTLCALPPNLAQIQLKWKINVDATISLSTGSEPDIFNVYTEYTNNFDEETNYSKHWGRKRLSFDNFQKFNELTIYAEITNNTERQRDNDIISKWDEFNRTRESLETKEYDNQYEHRFNSIDAKLQSITTHLEHVSNQLMVMRQQYQNVVISILSENKKHLMSEVIEKNEEMVKVSNVSNDEAADQQKVRSWLTKIVKLPQYFQLLIENGFDDMECIGDLTLNDLKDIGMDKIGHRKKLIKYAQKLFESDV